VFEERCTVFLASLARGHLRLRPRLTPPPPMTHVATMSACRPPALLVPGSHVDSVIAATSKDGHSTPSLDPSGAWTLRDTAQLRGFLRRAACGERIVVLAIGGSMPAGMLCAENGHVMQNCSWPARVASWLRTQLAGGVDVSYMLHAHVHMYMCM
jgi:hypothetical protein